MDKILDWPLPKLAEEVRRFLRLLRYIADFLPDLAEHTEILYKLTGKECNSNFPGWGEPEQQAFEAIKRIVTSSDCLVVIDHALLDMHKIFVATDASEKRSGAVLLFGVDWKSARPVAFNLKLFKNAELNYPVHEKELLAIIRALKKWKNELIGVPFMVLTDHRTPENFHQQKDLSRCRCSAVSKQ